MTLGFFGNNNIISPARLQLREDFDSWFAQQVLKELKKKIPNRRLRTAENKIRRGMKKIIVDAIMNSPEGESLKAGGKLHGQLGMTDARTRLRKIANIWADNTLVKVEFGKIPTFIVVNIGIIESDYQDVLNEEAAQFAYKDASSSDLQLATFTNILHWLNWMLTKGDSSIVLGYIYNEKAKKKYSRTGMGIMTKARGRFWRIPPEFAGFPGHNFATRAVLEVDEAIMKLAETEVQSMFATVKKKG